MARVVLNLTGGFPVGREFVLKSLYGPDVEVMDKREVGLREDPVGNLKAAVAEVESAEHDVDTTGLAEGTVVVAIIIPQNFLGDIGDGNAVREDIHLLRENFRKDPDNPGRNLRVGTDANTGRDLFEVDPQNGYERLVRAELRTEPVAPGNLSPKTGRVLVISRHHPVGRREAINLAFGAELRESMRLIVGDPPFNGQPRRSIETAIAELGGVDAVVVVKAVLRDLRFGDALGPDVAILIEKFARDQDTGQANSAGTENSGRGVFEVESLERFSRAELVIEPVAPRS